ncbi:MAG: phosphocholine cytidylyltransferase family protein [Prevotella sp.]|nr:phosphocholine cytidylyltransferase family protein [Prevotella sp.]
MIGVILAAGMAKRLRPLTDTKPKCLLEVGGKTLLQRTVDAMASAGISEFLVVTGYRANMIRDFLDNLGLLDILGNPRSPRISYIDNPDYEHNNNIFSLWLAMQKLHGQEVLLMDSDILCDPEAVRRVARQECSALAMQRHELGEEEMKIVVDADFNITEISKTCRVEDAVGESVGIEKMTSEYTEAIYQELRQMILDEGLIDIFYERAFERLIPQGHTFKVVDTTDLFSYELDTPEDFQKATASMPRNLI